MVLWRSSSRLAHPSNHFHLRARQPQGPAREGARALPAWWVKETRSHDGCTGLQHGCALFLVRVRTPSISHRSRRGTVETFFSSKITKNAICLTGIVLPAHPVLPKSVWICCDVHPPPNEPTGFWTNSKHADQGAASRTTALQNTNVFSSESPGWFSSVGNTGWWSKWHGSMLT